MDSFYIPPFFRKIVGIITHKLNSIINAIIAISIIPPVPSLLKDVPLVHLATFVLDTVQNRENI